MSNDELWDEYSKAELELWERLDGSKGKPWAKAGDNTASVCVFSDGPGRFYVHAAVHIWDEEQNLTTVQVSGDGCDVQIGRLEAIGADLDALVPDGTVQWVIDRVRAAAQVNEWLYTPKSEEATA